jgi:phosphate butyryltransferase
MLTSRADNDRARLASCALAQLYRFYQREGRIYESAASAIPNAAE